MTYDRASALDLVANGEGFAYLVDREGRIEAAGGSEWEPFARQNLAPAIADRSALTGHGLEEYIIGERPKEMLRRTLAALLNGTVDCVTYRARCDAPDVVRETEMTIEPVAEAGTVTGALFHSLIRSATARSVIPFLVPSIHDESLPIVAVCSYCALVREGEAGEESAWVPAELYAAEGGDLQVRVSHGICESCERQVLAEVEGLDAAGGG